MSNFGDLVGKLRKEKGLTLEQVARKVGSHKGYVSGIENGKVNPPSVKIVRKFARLFDQDERFLVRLAWTDKAPAMIREEARRILLQAPVDGARTADVVSVPLLNTLSTGYATDLTDGRPTPLCQASLVLPRLRVPVEFAATVCDDSMAQPSGVAFSRGDVVFLAREESPSHEAMVFVVYNVQGKRQARVCQLLVEPGERIVLKPLNADYSSEVVTHDDVDAVYRIVGRMEVFEPAAVDAQV